MMLKKVGKKHELILKYFLIFTLVFFTVFSDILIKQRNLDIQLTISSILIFLIIGLLSNNSSLLIITLLNLMLFGINGFNILTSIQALEIYYVWFLYKNNKKNIVIKVLIFWILIALPLICITSYVYNYNLSMESKFIIFIIFLNRIFNALISDMILDYIPFKRIRGMTNSRIKSRTLSNLLVYACIGSIVVPMIIFIIATNSSSQKQILELAVRDLKSSSAYMDKSVSTWTDEEKSKLKVKNPIQVYTLIDLLRTYISTSDKSVNFYLVNLSDTVVASDNISDYMVKGLEWLKEGNLTEIESNIYRWTAPREDTFIIKDYSTKQVYLYITTVNNSKAVITVLGAVYNSKAINIYLDLLKILLPLSIFVAIFTIVLKRIILNSISKLINITSGLPEKLKKNQTVMFEKANIYEIDSIIGNFQTMVDNLRNMILNVESTNKKLQESEQMLYNQANFDFLTQLPNRRYFIKHVGEVMDDFYINENYKYKQGIAFFFLDLDKFKTVNDTLGHAAGDELLKEIANRMNNVIKTYDSAYTFIARLSGDEFVIEFIYDNKEEIIKLANAIIEGINEPYIINNNEIMPRASVGISLYPEDGKDLESIFIKSDKSMYKSKASGGNKFIFYS